MKNVMIKHKRQRIVRHTTGQVRVSSSIAMSVPLGKGVSIEEFTLLIGHEERGI